MTDTTEIESILSLVYFHAYHAGHHDTVEGGYTDVYQVDRFEHHRDAVQEMLADDSEIAQLVAAHCTAQPAKAQVPDEAFDIIDSICAELTWPSWRSTSSRDRVMQELQELEKILRTNAKEQPND